MPTVYRPPVGIIQLADFEPAQMPLWINNATGGQTVGADTTLFTIGTQGYKATLPSGGTIRLKGSMLFDGTRVADNDEFRIDVYLTAVPTTHLHISLTNNLMTDGNLLQYDVPLGDLAVGWNALSWARSAMDPQGTWAARRLAAGVQIDISHGATALAATFDNLRVTTGETRGPA